MAGLKLNLQDAILIKDKLNHWTRIKGKNSSGNSFSYKSPFVFTVNTSISTTFSNLNIFINVSGGVTPSPFVITVDWGDGNSDTFDNSDMDAFNRILNNSHTYSTTDTFDVKVSMTSGEVPFYIGGSSNSNLVGIKSFGSGSIGPNFSFSTNCTFVPKYLPSTLTALPNRVFAGANLNFDLSNWDTRNIVFFDSLFQGNTAFNQNINSWDTSSGETFIATFAGATSFNQTLSNWDLSKSTSTFAMFNAATAFNQDISMWKTSLVSNMEFMFTGATAFNQNLGNLRIDSVANMNQMLNNTNLSTENYSKTLIGFADSHIKGYAKNNVVFGASNLSYNNTSYPLNKQFTNAVSARNYLVNTAGWTIADAGQV